jgi:hypothetical protein
MEVWKLLLLVVEAGAWVATCIDCANLITGGFTNSVDGTSGFEEVGWRCVVVGEGVGWKEVELNR